MLFSLCDDDAVNRLKRRRPKGTKERANRCRIIQISAPPTGTDVLYVYGAGYGVLTAILNLLWMEGQK
jgi:hypothetical protein